MNKLISFLWMFNALLLISIVIGSLIFHKEVDFNLSTYLSVQQFPGRYNSLEDFKYGP